MNFLAISGSLRPTSTNTSILRAAAALVPLGVTITMYDGLDDLPHFSPERDGEQSPTSVAHLRSLLQEADAVIICTPEYIHGMPGVLKNMLDWVVSSGEFVYKPVGIISAGPSDTGGARAHASLTHTLEVMTAYFTDQTSLIIPFVRTKLNGEGQITDPETAEALRRVLLALVNTVEQRSVTSQH